MSCYDYFNQHIWSYKMAWDTKDCNEWTWRSGEQNIFTLICGYLFYYSGIYYLFICLLILKQYILLGFFLKKFDSTVIFLHESSLESHYYMDIYICAL